MESKGKSAKSHAKPGPKEERVKINMDWKDAVAKALKKPKPPTMAR